MKEGTDNLQHQERMLRTICKSCTSPERRQQQQQQGTEPALRSPLLHESEQQQPQLQQQQHAKYDSMILSQPCAHRCSIVLPLMGSSSSSGSSSTASQPHTHRCSMVLPCIVTAAAPACSSSATTLGALIFFSDSPAQITRHTAGMTTTVSFGDSCCRGWLQQSNDPGSIDLGFDSPAQPCIKATTTHGLCAACCSWCGAHDNC
jgi:hypothetical protein